MCFTGSCGGATEGFSLCSTGPRGGATEGFSLYVLQGRVVEPLRDLVCVFYRAVWWSH